MTTRTTLLVCLALLAATLLLSVYFYGQLPERVPTHWGLDGKPDAYSSRTFATLFMPLIAAAMLALFMLLPALSPERFEVERFRGTYNVLCTGVVAYMAFVHFLTLRAALFPEMDLTRWLIGGMVLLFALIGNLLGKTRPNFFAGIRTPWTLASEPVWIATHRRAGRLTMACSGLALAALAVGLNPLAVVAIASFGLVWPAIDSYFVYLRMQRQGRL